MSLAVRDLSNHVERVELQPLGKVTALGIVDVNIPSLFQEELCRVVHERLILDQS